MQIGLINFHTLQCSCLKFASDGILWTQCLRGGDTCQCLVVWRVYATAMTATVSKLGSTNQLCPKLVTWFIHQKAGRRNFEAPSLLYLAVCPSMPVCHRVRQPQRPSLMGINVVLPSVALHGIHHFLRRPKSQRHHPGTKAQRPCL